jgi:dienelactone hydrolase
MLKQRYFSILCLLFIILMLPTPETPAQTANLSGIIASVGPSKYAVGFKTFEVYDQARVFKEKYDADGQIRAGERSRPLQICIWYPAEKDSNAEPVVYAEYIFPNPANTDFFDLLSKFQDREIYIRLHPLLQNDRGLVEDLMNEKMMAVKNASVKSGKYPLLIYHPDYRNSYCENVILCEWLAANGFVVATTQSVGATLAFPEETVKDFEAILRDREFLLTYLHDWQNIDHDKIGTLGFASGGLMAMLLAMRNSDIEAVVSLTGWNVFKTHFDLLENAYYHEPARMKAAIMQYYPDLPEQVDLMYVDSLEYCDKYYLKYGGLSPNNLVDYGVISAVLLQNRTDSPDELSASAYQDLCQRVLYFFEAYINKNEKSLRLIKAMPPKSTAQPNYFESVYIAAKPAPLFEDQLVNIFLEDGVAKGVEIYKRFRQTGSSGVVIREATLNNLGYQFLMNHDMAAAVEIFRLNTDAYPHIANTWSSLAEAYMYSRNTEQAVKYFRKTLEVLPADTVNNEQFKQIIREQAESYLNRVEQQ